MWHILIGEYAPSLHHVFDAFHHVFTIKIPAANTHFFQNTPQKRPQKRQNEAGQPLKYFF
jgi:hypothetical protein